MGSSTSYIDEVLADSPVFAYSFNDLSGSALNDVSGNGHAGIMSGSYSLGMAPMSPGLGYAASFTGGLIKVSYDNSFLYSDWAFEFVISTSQASIGKIFGFTDQFGDYNGPCIYINDGIDGPSGTLIVREKRGGGSAVVSGIEDSKYRHFICGRRGNNLEIWINGNLANIATNIPSSFNSSSPSINIAGDEKYGQNFVGLIDECAYFTKMLSADRISAHANRALDKKIIKGSAKLDNGSPAAIVLARDWATYQHIAQAVPSTSGDWSMYVNSGSYEITARGPDGYRPLCHGPVQAIDY